MQILQDWSEMKIKYHFDDACMNSTNEKDSIQFKTQTFLLNVKIRWKM